MVVIGVMLGGALGALARHGTSVWLQGLLAGGPYSAFPLATLLVNVIGCFLLSLLTSLSLPGLVTPAVRLALSTGFLGALTTFSTFELESDILLREGQLAKALIYIVGNLVLGYLAILLGRRLAL